jgi:L-alanine-DL-glutamate epimerase-like enolase superfamily enzyme
MQLTKAEVVPVRLSVKHPIQMAGIPPIDQVTAIFVRLETRKGLSAWGCTVAHPDLNDETPSQVIEACQACAAQIPDLHPTNVEYSLAQLETTAAGSMAALCAFDLAFHDLLGLATGLPLYRLLGGFRNKIQTSVTIPLTPLRESVALACAQAGLGFRMLKIKGGLDPEKDVERVRAIRRALPEIGLRLDADGAYSAQDALDVARALQGKIQMLEQPTAGDNLDRLNEVAGNSPVQVLADQSVRGPESALELAVAHQVPGISIKLVCSGGFLQARQVDAVARAARMFSMVSCLIEPALLIAAGLSLALSSPNVRYCDLDGHLDLVNDPSSASFTLKDGWLTASDVPGLGCSVSLE